MLDRLKLWWLSWKLNSDNLTTRVDAVQQLQNMEGPRVKETLVGALAALVPKLKHIEAGSRADVVKALWSIGDERVREALRGWLNTGDWSVAAVEVLRVLWTSEDTEARKMVTASLYHGSPILRRMTARALEKLKDPSAVGVLTVALETTYARLQSLDDLETLQAIAEALDTLEWTPITDAHRNVLRDIAIGEQIRSLCRERQQAPWSIRPDCIAVLREAAALHERGVKFELVYHPEISHIEEYTSIENPHGYSVGPYDGGVPPTNWAGDYNPEDPITVTRGTTVVDQRARIEVCPRKR